jgi:hypothetical protein
MRSALAFPRLVALALATGSTACGGQASSGSASVHGTIGGAPIPTTDVVGFFSTAFGFTTASVYFTNVRDTCGVLHRELSGGPEPPNTAVLAFSVERNGTTIAPGTYDIGCPQNPFCASGFGSTDAHCAMVSQTAPSSGTITFRRVDATWIEGMFDAAFGTDRVTGTFSAPVCDLPMSSPTTTTPPCGP